MRLVRLGPEPTKVGTDIRAALRAWGEGSGVLGGVTVFGCTPPGSRQPLDAVMVLPRGIIVIVGVDLPEPASKLEAPLRTPWTVDGWPLVRAEGAVNPAFEALQSASALARSLQSRNIEPLPVTTIVAVGPYVGQVTQPTSDLHRGVRVLFPSTTSLLAGARELATYEHACAVEPTQRLLRVLDEQAGVSVAELTAEGFPDSVAPDMAAADTMLITKITDPTPAPSGAPFPRSSPRRFPRRAKLLALPAAILLTCGIVAALLLAGGWGDDSEAAENAQRIDGVAFVPRGTDHSTDCARHSFGDVRAWLREHTCRSLDRSVFGTEVVGKSAAVAVTDVELPDASSSGELHELLGTAGSGGFNDLVADGHEWERAPESFDDAAFTVRQRGNRIRVVQAVWADESSTPDDVRLRALAERGMRLNS
ncbi:hypothetical protein [Parasphingorhabdus pacifica]